MLKKIGAVGGAVALVLCWPLATGQIGERIYLDTLGQYDNPYLTVTNDSYDRGYLTSEVVSKVVFKDELKAIFEDEGLPTEWYFKHHVSHGVTGISSTSELMVNDDIKPVIKQLWGENAIPVTFTTQTAITRSTDFTFTMNPIKVDNLNGNRADVAAFVMTGSVNADGAGEFYYKLPTASLTTVASEEMQLEGLEGSGKGRLDRQFWIGSQNLSLNSVSFKDLSAEKSVDINRISIDMNNVLSEPAEKNASPILTNTNQVTVGNLTSLDGEQYKDFNFQLSFAGLDYPAISRLGELSERFEQQMTEDQVREAAEALDELVAKGLTFSISDLSVMTPQGSVKSHLSLTVSPGLERASENMARIAENVTGDIQLSLPVELVEADPVLSERATMMEQSSIVERNETHYLLNMKIDGDKIILASGDQLPLAMLFMLFM